MITLTTAIRSRFSEPTWVEVSKINPGARFLLKPITRSKLREWSRKFGICQECGGAGTIVLRYSAQDVTEEKAREICPRCKGRSGSSWLDNDVRLAIIREICLGFEGVQAIDPTTGKTETIEYSEDVRDALIETAAFDVLFEEAMSLAVRREEQEGKP